MTISPTAFVARPMRKKKPSWFVYIIETKEGKFYTGITTDVERRFLQHKLGKKGAKFFHLADPTAIVFKEKHANRSKATKREIEIKKMSRDEKMELISDRPDEN